MKTLVDFQGVQVRLTDERRRHIIEHPEMVGMEDAVRETLSNPDLIVRSKTDSHALLNYRYYLHTMCWWKMVVCCGETVKVWFDREGDFLEVLFSDEPGFMRETENDAVMERVNEKGDLLGFSILQVSRIDKRTPLVAKLA